MIKAKAPNDSEGTVLGVEVGDHTLCLTRVPPRAPQVVGVTPVRPARQLRSKQSSMPFTTSQENGGGGEAVGGRCQHGPVTTT